MAKPSKGPTAHPFSQKHQRIYKGKGKVRTIDDVYEYAPSKVRRANVPLSLDRHEIQGWHVSDDEIDLTGLGHEAMEKLRAQLMQDDEDEDGGVDSEDDEDIDSEDAFEESDREGFAGSGFVRGARRTRGASNGKRAKVDLNEDADARLEESGSGSENEGDAEMDAGEFFDVLDVFDGRADVEGDEHSPSSSKKLQETQTRATVAEDEEEWGGTEDAEVGTSSDENEEGDEDEDEELCISASDAEDPSPEALADLETLLSNLDPAAPLKRKKDEAAEPGLKKRRRVADRTEAGEESEFGVRGSSTLKLDDLLAPLASSSSLAALKKTTKLLTSTSSKTKTLATPLPQRAQERLDREAAYEQTKEEVDKWTATMKRIKEAEHLSFPLQAEKPSRVSNLELAARFTPSNELESAIDKLLKSAQLRDEDIERTEALKMAHLSVEEVAARRAELRVMRELAFRADRKAKRIAKIKSKAYRRIRKKQRERLDAAGANEEEEGGDGEEERLKAEVERARERATLRHKNTGKWAREMKGREGLDQDQRQAIGEMLERGEKLRRRIHGEDSDDDEGEESSSDGEEQDEDAIKRGAFEELAALRGEDTETPALGNKNVFGMKFMREAAARRAREADAQAEELQRELGPGVHGEEEGEENVDGGDGTVKPEDAPLVQRTGGRLLFRPGTTSGALRSLGSLASDTSSVTLQSADLLLDLPGPEPNTLTPTPTPVVTSIPNPWLVPLPSSGPTRKRNKARVHKDADASLKSANKLHKQATKHEDAKARARDDAVLEIDVNDVLMIPEVPTPSEPGKKSKAKAKTTTAGDPHASHDEEDGSDVPSEVEAQERAVEGKKKKGGQGVRAFEQRDLVALAFAGDNVVQAFEEAKRAEVEADAPHEVDTTLPGWGAWGGTGAKKHARAHLKSLPGVTPNARTDHAKSHLIVSEKRDKKASKYLVRELPHPYTSHAQFERRMAVPLGSEWNTRVGFQRATVPRVVKKMGVVIDPLEKLF